MCSRRIRTLRVPPWRTKKEAGQGRFADQERQIALLNKQVQRLTHKLDREEAASLALRDELRELTSEHHQQNTQQAAELNRKQAGHQEEQQRFAATHTAELTRLRAVH